MKNTIFGLVALFFAVSYHAQAASSTDVRLQLKSIPTAHLVMGGKYATFSVYADGYVVESFSSALPMPIPPVTIKQLSTSEMVEIEQLIDAARDGKITTVTHPIHCMAIATSYDLATADNGRVFLGRNALCQDPTVNETPAAARLVEILRNLRTEAATIRN